MQESEYIDIIKVVSERWRNGVENGRPYIVDPSLPIKVKVIPPAPAAEKSSEAGPVTDTSDSAQP